jgi:hypothetical protein
MLLPASSLGPSAAACETGLQGERTRRRRRPSYEIWLQARVSCEIERRRRRRRRRKRLYTVDAFS